MEENKYPSILATPMGGTQYVVNISQMFGSLTLSMKLSTFLELQHQRML